MGRITVFAADDINSLSVLRALENRKLPFARVSVDANPSRSKDVKALCGKSSVPRVFFNTRPVGGVDETLQELTRWDIAGSALEKYETEIEALDDPINPKLAPTTDDPKGHSGLIVPLAIELPDGTSTSYHDIAEKLRNSLQPSEIKHKGVVYKKAFSGSHAVQTVQDSMSLSRETAVVFCDKLLEAGVMHRLPSNASGRSMDSCEGSIYRLQPDATPNILNSYRLWPNQPCREDAIAVLSSLDASLRRIELDSACRMAGLMDCAQAMGHADFPKFEEMVCSLQSIDFLSLTHEERLPFCLNLYNLMIRYAFIKVGIPIYDTDRLHFCENVQFQVSGQTFSFREWIDGVLRGNAKSSPSSKVPFKAGDPRREFALSNVNPLFHYALNSGPHVGTRTSVPFRMYTPNKIDQQLRLAAEVYWEDEANFEIDQKAGVVKIPLTLKDDLSDERAMMVERIQEHLTASQRSAVQSLGEKPKVSFEEANWARNYCKFARYDRESIVSETKGLKAIISRFRKPRMPENEKLRLATVRKMNILDTLPEERFDRITQSAQDSFASPLVCITFVEDTDYFVKSVKMLGPPMDMPSRFGRDTSFCGHVILEDKMMIVPDIQQDDRFADNPMSNAMGFRFYAGANVIVPAEEHGGEKVNIGTLCVFDNKPRYFSSVDKLRLTEFADEIGREVVHRQKEAHRQKGVCAPAAALAV